MSNPFVPVQQNATTGSDLVAKVISPSRGRAGCSLYGESVTLDGTMPVVAWASGLYTLPPVPGEEAWVMRLGPDGVPLDHHGGLPGVDAYLGDPYACAGVSFPIAVGGVDGIPEVLYSVECGFPSPYTQSLRAVQFGL